MTIGSAILVSIALSIDTFAVSMSGSVSMGRLRLAKVAGVALSLAFVQTVFLLGGYYAGDAVARLIEKWGRYLGFAMLLYVGVDMIVEAVRNKEESQDFSGAWKILVAAVATSIDAVAVGASFGLSLVPAGELWLTAGVTFAATVIFAVSGMFCGSAVGRAFGRPAKIVAGIVLIAIGLEILL